MASSRRETWNPQRGPIVVAARQSLPLLNSDLSNPYQHSMRVSLAFLLPIAFLGACGSEDPVEPAGAGNTKNTVKGPETAPSKPNTLPEKAASGWPEEAAARGLTYKNHSGEPSKPTILEANGPGVALLDLGQDGDLDVVFSQGLDSLGQTVTGPGADLEIFINDGQGNFERAPGPGISGWWTGLATGDINGDGRADLVAAGYGRLEVLVQNDAGMLESWQELISHGPGERLLPGADRPPGLFPAWSTSVALFDADGDGRLDLYAGHYLRLDPLSPHEYEIIDGAMSLPCRWKGHDVYCGPRGLEPQGDRIYRGNGDGSFRQYTAQWLPDHEAGFTLAVKATDVDGDGDTDLLVANDSSANLLLINDGHGVFTDHGYESGLAFSADGNPEAGMGVASGDVNRDGKFDYAIANFSDEPTSLYFANDTGFSNQTFRFGLGKMTRELLSWSVHMEDFDGDGWLELFSANGHVYPQADEDLTGTSYAQADTLWKLGPIAKAQAVSPLAKNSILAEKHGTRGTAVGDLDGDGRPDIVLTYIDELCGLGMNRTGDGNTRLAIHLSAPAIKKSERKKDRRYTPRDAMGAKVLLVLGTEEEPFALIKEVQTSQGFQSASASTLYFGMGKQENYNALKILWPSGDVLDLPAGPANRTLFIEEGSGIIREDVWE